MSQLESTMVSLGSPCPDFALTGVDGKLWHRDDFRAPALLVVFMCNHCPYVQAVDGRINELAKAFSGRCDVVGINANDAKAYPEDGFEAMRERARALGFVFPYLRDESQAVAKGFGAVCTPDFFLYDQDLKLRYRGRLDDNWQDESRVVHQELRIALEALLSGQPVPEHQRPSMGCSIKWKRES
jgi:thiol-disulfide isomerase/thioredoxin